MLKSLSVVYLMAVLPAMTNCFAEDKAPVLKDVFKKDFLIGMALNDDVVSGKDPQAASIVEKHCNTITPENVMKWQRIHPEPGKYDFAAADRFVEFGLKNKMFIVGHTLVWHRQTPGWVFEDDANHQLSRDAMLARMKDHIFTVMGRYKGKVRGWDVVNEAFEEDGSFRKSKWLEIIGEDFIVKAFEYAHQADPDAKLYYNEFHNEYPAKRDSIVRLVKDLKAKGLRIDGVGLQEHCDMNYPAQQQLEEFITAMASLGVKVMITELDISVLPGPDEYKSIDLNDVNNRAKLEKELNPYINGLPDEMQTKLASRYAELFRIYRKHADVISRVTFWGVYDKTTWLHNWPLRGRTNHPLLFDREYKPKPAFYAVVKAAEGQ